MSLKAMILAAGRGERMRPLSDRIPKPLLEAGGKPLIVWQIERLVQAGFTELVVNHAWLGSQLEDALEDGSRWGARIAWSREGVALETAGGVVTALPLLEARVRDEPFVVVSADIYTDFEYARLTTVVDAIRSGYPQRAAHLVLTDNPPWHPRGDMAIANERIAGQVAGRIAREGDSPYTYANIGVFHPRVFDGLAPHVPLSLFPWAYAFADQGRITGEIFHGVWDNIGTPEQLRALDRRLQPERIA